MGRRLAALRPQITGYIRVPGADHNELLQPAGLDSRAAMNEP